MYIYMGGLHYKNRKEGFGIGIIERRHVSCAYEIEIKIEYLTNSNNTYARRSSREE